MAEIYSGTARMAASFASMGVESWAWDILYGEGADLLKESVLKDLKSRVSASEFQIITFALQCSTWSRARRNDGRGPPPVA